MAIQVVVSATRKNLFLTFKDENGAVIDVTNWTARLQGKSKANGLSLDVAGVVSDGPGGTFKWEQLGGGGFPGTAELNGRPAVKYTLKAKLTDAGGLIDYGPEFELEWLAPPI